MRVEEKLIKLRSLMKQCDMQAYIIPTDDFHGSEYVGEYFKVREYMSGFTGSAGTLVVTENEACLWTDGRYFLQAGVQLEGSTIRLMKMGEPGVPKIPEYLAERLPDGARIGFDGRTMTMEFAEKIREKTKERHMVFADDRDLCGEIWGRKRPVMSAGRIWALPVTYAGQSRADKLAAVRKCMEEKHADHLVLSALDEIAWLLNLRGSDIDFSPVFLSFMVIGRDAAVLFVQEGVVPAEILRDLEADGVKVSVYDEIYDHIAQLPPENMVWMDGSSANYRLYKAAETHTLLMEESPVVLLKAVKNSTEISNLKNAHVKDGVAVTRLMHWMKTRAGKEEITEISAAEKLKCFRRMMDGYIDESFSPIIAYGEHGAIVHYEADEQTNDKIEPCGLCLTDTGGQYLEGTTDITRTFVLGEATAEEKRMFTLVLKGHLRLGAARFKAGVCGQNLDYLAREALWAEGLDYNHGTGHGVGYLLNVHETPPRISWRISGGKAPVPFAPGMVCSNEPGIYLEGKFGIRHENLILCCEDKKTEYGQFLRFENLTMVPFDKDGIDMELLTADERDLLNAYHKTVFEKISPWFEGEELEWLKAATSPLER